MTRRLPLSLIFLLTLALPASASEIGIETPGGSVTLVNPEVTVSIDQHSYFSATVNNDLKSSLTDFTVKVEAQADCGARGVTPVSFTAEVGPVWAGESNRRLVQIELSSRLSGCTAVSVKSIKPVSFGSPSTEKTSNPASDAWAAAGSLIASRIAYMKSLPMISSGGKQTFVASDKKCAAQFQDALPGEGLEAKKRLAEIISLCGTMVDSASRVESYRMDGEYGFVSVFESDVKGWVPRKWIWVPDRK